MKEWKYLWTRTSVFGTIFIDRLVDEFYAMCTPLKSQGARKRLEQPWLTFVIPECIISASTASAITSTTGSKRRLDAEGDNLAGDDDDDDDGDKVIERGNV